MSFLFVVGVPLIGWLFIIIIYNCSKAEELYKNEMVEDGNNLFKTAVLYILLTVACHFLNYSWVHWVVFVFTFVCAFLPFWGAVILLFSKHAPISSKFTGLLCNWIPMLLSLNILFTYILKYEV